MKYLKKTQDINEYTCKNKGRPTDWFYNTAT